jgi:hypothetical protein
MASSILSCITCSDLDNASEDDKESELSDPSDSKDAHIPVTAQTLQPALLDALRRSFMRHPGGAVDFGSWMRALRGGEQWARMPELVLKEALDVLWEEE